MSLRNPLVAGTIPSEQIAAHAINLPPDPAGYYELGEAPYTTRFPILRKPNRLHRWAARAFLGMRWVDAS